MDSSLPKPLEMSLGRKLNNIGGEQSWILEVTKCAPQLAIRQLWKVFKISSPKMLNIHLSTEKINRIVLLSPTINSLSEADTLE
jgi:hypothetical protein